MAAARMGCFLRQLTRGMAAERSAEQSDRQLVERLLAGPDETAFEALVRRHGPMVYRVCWRALQHAEDCEDAFQAVFLLLARKLGTVKKRDSLASWLHGVAHRLALDARKQAGRRRRREADSGTTRDGPPDEMTWKELRTVLDVELAALPEKHRLPLILCYLEGRAQEEAARQLGWSKSTLLRRLEEARTALGVRLTRKGLVWPAAVSAVLLSDCVAPAALSPKLIGSTVTAAATALAGSVVAGVVSTKVTALVEGVRIAMFTNKMKSIVAALLVGSALMSGALILLGSGRTPWPALASAQSPQESDKPKARKTPPGVPEVGETDVKPVVVRENAQVIRVAWSADGSVVATVIRAFDAVEANGENGLINVLVPRSTVKIWDAKTGKLIKALPEEKRTYLEGAVYSPDKKTAAYLALKLSTDGPGPPNNPEVRIVDAKTWAAKQNVEGAGWLSALAFSPDGKILAYGGHSGHAETSCYVKLWDVQGAKEIGGTRLAAQPIPGADGYVLGLAFSPDGKLLAAEEHGSRSNRAKVRLYDGRTGEPKQEFDFGETKRIFQVAFTADGKHLVSACGPVKLWDVQTGKVVKTFDTRGSMTFCLAVSRDGRLLAAGGFRKEKDKTTNVIFVWDAKTGELKQTLPWREHPMWISSFAFSPDGKFLAVSGQTDGDGRVKDGEKTKGILKIIPVGR
jgi:RNA polymerase sigma factor (sigma-70 family)